MTSVNITTTKNTVTVNEGNTTVVTVKTAGPQGIQGIQGVQGVDGTATITLGTTSTGDAGTNASVTNTGTSTAATLNFTIPRGNTGATGATGNAATIAVGNTTTGDAGTNASVSNSGTSSAATFDFTIPRGATGATGDTGPQGIQGIQGIQGPAGNDGSDATVNSTNVNAAGAVMNTDTSVAAMSFVVNEDNMSSDSDTKVPTQQSVKAYADTKLPLAGGTMTGNIAMSGSETVDGRDLSVDGTKLDGIESNATADQTGAEIKTAYEAESNTNAYTDAEKSKLAAIEANADVTDATNVDAAGAVMNSDTTTAAMGFVVDEDDMASDSNTKVPTQQSVKAYFNANSSDTTYSAGTGLSLIGTTFNVDQIALTTVQVAANESAQLALTTQEGDIVVRSDQNKSYVRNSGTAGTMADFTELLTPTDQVLSVNGNTGAITAAQIAAAVEAASDSNTFTDADHTKLNGIETSATADQTDSEIKTAYENNSDTNAFTDAEKTKLSGIEANATADQTDEEIQDVVGAMLTGNTESGITVTYQDADGTIDFAVASQTDENFTTADHSKLDGIESNATADQTGAEIKSLYEGESDTNAFTDAEKTKLSGIEASATADQTAAEIRTLVESANDSNVFTDADHTKLNGIETSATADQTASEIKTLLQSDKLTVDEIADDAITADKLANSINTEIATNTAKTSNATHTGEVTGSTALTIADDVVDEANLKVSNSPIDGYVLTAQSGNTGGLTWAAQSSGGLSDLVDDTTPQLGGGLDTNNHNISFTDNDKAKFGDSDDLQIYHNGNHSYIADTGTGNLRLIGNGNVDIMNAEATEYKARFITNGAVELYHDDSKKLETSSSGISVTGDIVVSGTVDGVDIATLNSTVSGKLSNIVEDTSPQLGGDLDMNSNFISSGILGVKNTGSQSELRLYCESNNAHYASIKAPAHADFSGDLTFTLPSGYGSSGQVLQSNGSGGTSWVAQTTAYTNSSVDSHLNTSSASSGQILSWNGSDYAWVADQTGGGGGGGISNVVEDTTPQLGGNLDMQSNNITGTGTITANSVASSANGMRKITASTSSPSGGSDGDVWIKYTA